MKGSAHERPDCLVDRLLHWHQPRASMKGGAYARRNLLGCRGRRQVHTASMKGGAHTRHDPCGRDWKLWHASMPQ